MASSTEAEEELLATKLAHVRHFDETSADFARSLLTDCNNADKSIEVARHSACAQYSLLSSLQDETAEAASKIENIRKKPKARCESANSKDSSLDYLAGFLGIDGEELFASSSKSVHADETKIEPLDVTLARMRSAANAPKALDDEIEGFMRSREDAAQAQQADSAFNSLLDFWLRLYIKLAQDNDDKNNPNDSALSSSSVDDSRLGLLVYEDLLDKQIANQKRTIQLRQQQQQKLKEDIKTVQEVVVALKAQNLQLNSEIKANHIESKDSICRTLSSKKSKIRRASGLLQSTGAKARASLVSAEFASPAEEGASPMHVTGKSVYEDAVLQESLKSLRDAFAEGDAAADALERQTMRTQNARQFLEKAARSIREEKLVDGSKEALRAYERLMKQDKALLLLDGTVEGRTFADWLPELVALVKKT